MSTDKLTVYYDGACPLCRREIEIYRRRAPEGAIEWLDAAAGDVEGIAPDLSRTAALARFHVRLPDGTLASGARGFTELWSRVPGFRWLGKLARLRIAQPGLELAYRGFLRVRPAMQWLAARAEVSGTPAYPRWLERELRSNHAGEWGAVAIYRGILAASRSAAVRAFAERHLQAERRHLQLMRTFLPPSRRSRLLPLWYAAGFAAGALPALFGDRGVYATIEAVENFVDAHYLSQINRLAGDPQWRPICVGLESCRQDELLHRDEARLAVERPPGVVLRLWLAAVAAGSSIGVAVARRV